jgi:hypothetical protein
MELTNREKGGSNPFGLCVGASSSYFSFDNAITVLLASPPAASTASGAFFKHVIDRSHDFLVP